MRGVDCVCAHIYSGQTMAHVLSRPNSLEPLPGEAAKPSLRLLERPARPASRPQPGVTAPGWLERLRQLTRRSLAG